MNYRHAMGGVGHRRLVGFWPVEHFQRVAVQGIQHAVLIMIWSLQMVVGGVENACSGRRRKHACCMHRVGGIRYACGRGGAWITGMLLEELTIISWWASGRQKACNTSWSCSSLKLPLTPAVVSSRIT